MRSSVAFAWIVFILITGCNKDKEAAPQHETAVAAKTNITKALSSIDSLNTFAALINDAALTDADVAAGFTVLAPVNTVFSDQSVAWSPHNNLTGLTGQTIARAAASGSSALKDGSVINDYIIKGKISLASLVNGIVLRALSGKSFTVSLRDEAVFVNGVRLSSQSVHQASDYVVYSLSAFINYSTQLAFDPAQQLPAKIPGDTLMLRGQNFSPDVTKNMVTINGRPALVNEATATRLVITVPGDATSGAVQVTVDNKTITSPRPLTVLKAQVSTIAAITALQCGSIEGMAMDKDGTLYFTDPLNNRVISYSAAGQVIVYQPTKIEGDVNGDGLVNEQDRVFLLNRPRSIAIDGNQHIYVTTEGDEYGSIYQLTKGNTNQAILWAGSKQPGPVTGDKMNVEMYPSVLKAGSDNSIYFWNDLADDNIGLYRISGNTVSMIVNNVKFRNTFPGLLYEPDILGIEIDDNTGAIYLSDEDNWGVWKMVNGQITAFAGINTNEGSIDGVGSEATLDGGVLCMDGPGRLFAGDWQALRIINPYRAVTTVAGGPNPNNETKDGVGKAALFAGISGIVKEAGGSLYVGTEDGKLRKITFVQ